MRLPAALLALAGLLAYMPHGVRGVFVAVGEGGRRMSSADGRRWENDTCWKVGAVDADEALHDVAFGLGRFIAVGGGAAKGRITISRNGKVWRDLPPWRGAIGTIVFGGGRFIAGHGAELLWSADGEKFVAGEKLAWPGSVRALRAAWGDGEAGHRCVIIGDLDPGDAQPRVSWRATTADGAVYTSRDRDTPPARDIAYGSGHWVVVGPDGLIESSHDGQTWQRHATLPGENFQRVVWTGTRFVVSGGKAMWFSPDGVNWTKTAPAIPCRLVWAREGMLGLGFSAGGNIQISRDLTEWAKLPVPPGASFEAVAYGTP
ncbi:MAG: hypothetical protein K8R23_05975 [Chthoniobacter sp.]|nr:hypothetical protein [Chthoniobacter sp.]